MSRYTEEGREMNAPRLVNRIPHLLCNQPQRGSELAIILGAEIEDVFEALVWMEARGYAALRPEGAGSRFHGWVTGARRLGSI